MSRSGLRDQDVREVDTLPSLTVKIARDDWSHGVVPRWSITGPTGAPLCIRSFRNCIDAQEHAARRHGFLYADLGVKNWFGAREPYRRYVRLT
jgi:hypothetical protein